MASQPALTERAAVRRRDRAVEDDAWIVALLERAPYAVMATVQDGQPFTNSNIFVYDEEEHAIYMHSARTGRTPGNVAEAERVCVSVSEMGRLLPADRAFNMSVEYAGVVIFGRAELLLDDGARRRALQRLVGKYFPHLEQGVDYADPTADELARTAVYRIEIEEWSGKQKSGEPDHPGAFLWPSGSPAAASPTESTRATPVAVRSESLPRRRIPSSLGKGRQGSLPRT